MKKRTSLSVFSLVFVILGLFAACGDLTEPGSDSTKPNSTYTVKFEANGGSPAPAQQSISKGGKVVMPPAMTKTGYGFDGWYKDAACTNLWNFTADTVSGNITLYANWDANFHTVNFEANGGIPVPDPQNIAQGGLVVPPPAMTKTGYGFGGWYKEANCINQWDFTTDTVSGNITLYAKWDLNYHTVSFDTNGGSPAPNPQSITHGGKVVMPPAMTRTGYSFGGWYKDAACTNLWDFVTDTVSGNITLYAKWDFSTSPSIPSIPTTPVTTPGTTLADKLAWLKTNAERDTTYVLEISTAYEELPPQNLFYLGRNNITIRLKGIGLGRVIELINDSLFTVGDGVTFILEENLILYGGIRVNSGGSLIMNQSVKITGSSRNGVYVDSGTFTMNGGEISGNSSSSGGGVYVNSGTFTMSGGEIYGNSASSSSSGGGVYVNGNNKNAFFDKIGGTIYGYTAGDSKSNVVKNGNVVQDDRGHAVYVAHSDTSYIKRKETTAWLTDNLSYNGTVAPPVSSGAWDF